MLSSMRTTPALRLRSRLLWAMLALLLAAAWSALYQLQREYRLLPRTALAGQNHATDPKDCISCHPTEYWTWQSSLHATAFEPLLATGTQGNSECLGCHSTSFNQPHGYVGLDTTPGMAKVGCDACHGLGGAHVANPSRSNIVLRPEPDSCRTCHTPTNVCRGKLWNQEVVADPSRFFNRCHSDPNDPKSYFTPIQQRMVEFRQRDIEVTLELFLNTHCERSRKLLLSLIDLTRRINGIQIRLHFIAHESGDDRKAFFFQSEPQPHESTLDGACSGPFVESVEPFQTRFGKEELLEQQMLAYLQQYYWDQFPEILECLYLKFPDLDEADRWEECLFYRNLNLGTLQSLASMPSEFAFSNAIEEPWNRQVRVSPTLYIDKVYYEGSLEEAALLKALCLAMPGTGCAEFYGLCLSDEDCREMGPDARCVTGEDGVSRCVKQPRASVAVTFLSDEQCLGCDSGPFLADLLSLNAIPTGILYRNWWEIPPALRGQLSELGVDRLPALLLREDDQNPDDNLTLLTSAFPAAAGERLVALDGGWYLLNTTPDQHPLAVPREGAPAPDLRSLTLVLGREHEAGSVCFFAEWLAREFPDVTLTVQGKGGAVRISPQDLPKLAEHCLAGVWQHAPWENLPAVAIAPGGDAASSWSGVSPGTLLIGEDWYRLPVSRWQEFPTLYREWRRRK